MTIAEWQRTVYQNSLEHGFYDGGADINRALLLAVGEICEAQEELRAGHAVTEVYTGPTGKPEGFPIELADAVIRLFDTAWYWGINLEEAIRAKHEYNATRPYKHGKQF